MNSLSSEKIPLRALILDSDAQTSEVLRQALLNVDAADLVKVVNSVDAATEAAREMQFSVIFVDPLGVGLSDASNFIFRTRNEQPEVPFILYVDTEAAEHRRNAFYKGERSRFEHYYHLDKKTPVSSFVDELDVVLKRAVRYFGSRMSYSTLQRIKREAARLSTAQPNREVQDLLLQVQRLSAQISLQLPSEGPATQSNKVFLSHRFAETDYVSGLTQLLTDRGFVVVTGQSTNTYVSQAVISRIKECDFFLCLMTRDSLKDDGTYTTSPWLLEEKGAALALNKRLVLMVEEGVSDFGGLQGDWQRIHFGPKGFLTAAIQAVRQLQSYRGDA